MVPVVSVQWLRENLTDQELIILDASPASNKSSLPSHFPGMRIPGARYFDLKHKFSDPNAEMPNTLPQPEAFQGECQALGINQSSKIVVYDNLGIYSSPRVWWMFKAMGHDRVSVLNGGLVEWGKHDYPMEERTEASYERGDFVVKPGSTFKKEMEDILQNLETKTSVVLDARSKGRFDGTAPEPREGLSSGHIPHSKSLPFSQVLEEGKFKSTNELKELFEVLNPEEKPLIFSCGSGLTACITYLAAELATDAPKSVYDGSWTEWAQKQAGLIEKNA
ncbi:MAG: rhodanese-like domain-containing protein [Bacteroidota bacterium]